MSTPVVYDFPPNAGAIMERFRNLPLGAVFAYHDTIYAPMIPEGTPLPEHLIVHERTHFAQQFRAGGAEAWWARYIVDDEFRLKQELEAYRAQIASVANRAERRRLTAKVVHDLAGPMYGRIVTKEQARALLSQRPGGKQP